MTESLKNRDSFTNVYTNGKSAANKYLIMYVLKNDMNFNRLGVSVSKKVGNSVVRHRITRLLRESFRLNDETFHSGWDIVVVARKSAKGKDYKDIEGAFMHLAKLHKMVGSLPS